MHMRKTVGLVLLGLGAFLVTTALLVAAYVPGQVKKTPLNVDSITRLSGHAAALPSGGSSPVRALSHTVANGDLSDGDVVVFDSFSCLIKDDGTTQDCTDDTESGSALITASTDNFATDRVTAMAVQDPQYVSADSQHEGLVNKFPFSVQQQTYPFWDGVLARTVDAVFQGEEDIDGLKTYRFLVNSQNETAEIAAGIEGTYSSEKTMWIDPVTGSIIKQQEKQVRKTGDGTTVLDLDFGFTDETVAANVESAKSSGGQIGMLGTAPWLLGLLGLLSLGAGGFLLRGAAIEARAQQDSAGYAETYGDADAYATADTAETYEETAQTSTDDTQAIYQDGTQQFFDEAEGETRRSRREAE